jgi:hypothetical protein
MHSVENRALYAGLLDHAIIENRNEKIIIQLYPHALFQLVCLGSNSFTNTNMN